MKNLNSKKEKTESLSYLYFQKPQKNTIPFVPFLCIFASLTSTQRITTLASSISISTTFFFLVRNLHKHLRSLLHLHLRSLKRTERTQKPPFTYTFFIAARNPNIEVRRQAQSLLIDRKGRGNCDCTTYCWTSFGRYYMENHKGWHLNGTILGSFVRPAVLITDAYNSLNNQPYRRQKDKEFGDILKKTLRSGGNVLLPVDTAGRVLELILMLESYWADENLNYPIYFLTYVASSTIDYVKSFLEWMSDNIAKSFEQTRENIFLLKYVTLLVNKTELDNAPEGPKDVVLSSMASLEAGFSHDIFVEWGNDVKNLVLFTERGQSTLVGLKVSAQKNYPRSLV